MFFTFPFPLVVDRKMKAWAAVVTGAKAVKRNFAGVLASGLDRLDLVTREEFDVQRKVLERTRARLEALEAELQQLEQARATDSDTGA